MNLVNLGEQIKEIRNNLGYSQEGFVTLLNPEISVKTLQRAEKGEEVVSKDTYMNVCEYLDIPFTTDGEVVVYEIDSLTDLTMNLKKMEIINPYRDSFDEKGLDLLLEMTESMGKDFNNFKKELLFEKEMYGLKKRLDEAGIKIFTRIRKGVEVKYFKKSELFNTFEGHIVSVVETEKEFLKSNKEPLNSNTHLKYIPCVTSPSKYILDPIFYSQLELYIYKSDSKEIRKNKSGKLNIIVPNYDYSNCIDCFEKDVTHKVYEYLQKNKEVKYKDKDGKLSMIKTSELNKII